MKKYSEKTAAAVFNRILSSARKMGVRTCLFNPWTDAQGRYCACDGFRAYRLHAAPAGVSLVDDPAPKMGVDLENLMPAEVEKMVEMPAPDAGAVKAFQKATGKSGEPYDLGDGFPMVNANYLLDMIRLFPAARWYVDADPYLRMIRPIYAVCEQGDAALCPVRSLKKPYREPKQEQKEPAPAAEPSPAPQRRETIPAAAPAAQAKPEPRYFVYVRPAGAGNYSLADIQRGRIGVNVFFAPRYTAAELERLQELLDRAAAANKGVAFQIRKDDRRSIVYQAEPAFTPEMFAETVAA